MIEAVQVAFVSLVSVISTDLYADVASAAQIKLKHPLSCNNSAPVLSQLEIGSFFKTSSGLSFAWDLVSRAMYMIVSGAMQKQAMFLICLLTCKLTGLY